MRFIIRLLKCKLYNYVLSLYLRLRRQSYRTLSLKTESLVSNKASHSDTKIVNILNVNFFDWSGSVIYKGGAERYVADLAKLIAGCGYDVRIIQNSNEHFEINHNGLKVIGIPAKSGWDFNILSTYYQNNFSEEEYTICSPLDLACNISGNRKVIGINHGIHWDTTDNNIINYTDEKYRNMFKSLINVDACACVDTNFINWVRTYDYNLSEKLLYIPNYFDSNQFTANEKHFKDDEIVILFPRRLYKARGFYLAISLIDELIPKYRNVKFSFVGQADKNETKIVLQYIDKYPGRIAWTELDMVDMHLAYAESQIVIIPTVQSEGTSLSCIEALATNNAVVSSNIGGLPNLIIDNYNGLLINPTVDELTAAVTSLIEDKSKRAVLAANGLKVAEVLEKQLWENKWKTLLSKTFN